MLRRGGTAAIPAGADRHRDYADRDERQRPGGQQPLPAHPLSLLFAAPGAESAGLFLAEGVSILLSHPRERSW
jgi:hypothetical protein